MFDIIKIYKFDEKTMLKKLNHISIAILCIGGFFKHNSFPYANIIVSIGFIFVALTFILMSFSKESNKWLDYY